ncbi:MAG: hypothetical protein JSS29_15915 [Proteobacteria bacterium]|nr:hypothetical protein [Pseudomonadota bacterium]
MKRLLIVGLLAALGSLPRMAAAGPFADDMAKCLVTSTTQEDRIVLAKWVFNMMAQHPDVASLANITPAQRQGILKDAAALIQRLLTDSCRSQTRAALQNEGAATIQYGFQVLGASAMRGLMTEPHVMEGAKALGQYLDEAKIKELLANTPP